MLILMRDMYMLQDLLYKTWLSQYVSLNVNLLNL